MLKGDILEIWIRKIVRGHPAIAVEIHLVALAACAVNLTVHAVASETAGKADSYTQRVIVTSCILFTTCWQAHAEDRPALPEKPNIVFILAEDMGYGDLSC